MTAEIKTIQTPDGQALVWLFRPPAPSSRGVILYMDAFGPRPALFDMAKRMAAWGLTVALPDLFYRFGPYAPFDAKTAFGDEVERARLMHMLGGTTQGQTLADTAHVLDLLAAEGSTGPIGTVGYCMGGARALNAAAVYPGRIAAAASLHGGNLASDAPDSPHLRAGSITARLYVGVAGVDRSFPPAQSALLAQALRAAEVDHMIEVYRAMQHGWTVPDSAVFDAAGAARHWRRLETLFAETLLAWGEAGG